MPIQKRKSGDDFSQFITHKIHHEIEFALIMRNRATKRQDKKGNNDTYSDGE
jgi:hypothetical protein